MKKKSLIELLQEKYPEYSLKELNSFIFCSKVKVNSETVKDKNRKVSDEAEIEIIQKKYVSRGGFKLEHALDSWEINVRNKVVIDAGSSTGGFTDCLLQYGSKKVYSVDVGYNQLDYKLRVNPSVGVFEKTNIMDLNKDMIQELPDFGVMDLSFRSIKGAALHLLNIVKDKKIIALLKPQFELDDNEIEFNGVLDDNRVLEDVIKSTLLNLYNEKVYAEKIVESPIHGRKGNREFLVLLGLEKKFEIEDLFEKVKELLK